MIHVLIADDHDIVRQGLRNILNDESDIKVVGEASCGYEVINILKKIQIDVAVLDISMPGLAGLELLSQIKSYYPRLPVLFFTMHPEHRYGVRAMRGGAMGYITKDKTVDILIQAIRKVFRGGIYVGEQLGELIAHGLHTRNGKQMHELLSNREYQVMSLIAKGMSTKEIADNLSLSTGTIYTHRERIFDKMKMRTNTEVVYYAISNDLVE